MYENEGREGELKPDVFFGQISCKPMSSHVTFHNLWVRLYGFGWQKCRQGSNCTQRQILFKLNAYELSISVFLFHILANQIEYNDNYVMKRGGKHVWTSV